METARDEVDGPRGLDPEEARARLAAVGPNRLVAVERWGWLREALSIVADPMALMLALAAVVYLLLGDVRNAIILACALVPVLGVDVVLEARSRQALKKLAGAVRPRARVLRGGVEREVPTEELVPGDLLLFQEGDVLHADGAVRRARNLTVDESQLTGESEPQAKEPARGAPRDEPQRFYAGSLVLAGSGMGEVTETGPRTRFGAIARLVAESAPEPTPLQRRTSRMVRQLGAVAAVVAAAVFALALRRGASTWQALLAAVSLAIAAMPEEFPLVFTLFLSLGAFRLSRRGVLVRRLASVETLGSTTVICTDKTGTVTAGQFVLEKHLPLGVGVTEEELLEAALLACEPEPADHMERALVAHVAGHGVAPAAVLGSWRLVRDHDFDAVGKHMSHVWRARGAATERVAAKGALEGILEHCRLEPGERERAEARNAELAGEGMRVLAVAARDGPPAGGGRAEDESDLRLLGLLGFRDPLRPEVPSAIAECTSAGIAVKLVTGDHALTAHAMAEAAGIPHADESVLTGADLDRLAPGELARRLRSCAILARVRPEQKHAIVEALAKDGEVVAMTGDGINDAPALRRADIGISLGRRGTEVARAAADLVLLDDDFTAIVATVREGRAIYENIQRAFLYLLAFHIPIVGVALAAPLLGLPLLFQPVHLVWLELIVHPVSALVFEAEPPPADLMRRPPRRRGAPLVPGRLAIRSAISGVVLTVGAVWIYWTHLAEGVAYARSMGLTVVIAGAMLLVWAERGAGGSWSAAPFPRTWRFWGVWGLVALTLPAFMYFRPAARVFEIVPLKGSDWLLALGLAAAGMVWRVGGGREARPGAPR